MANYHVIRGIILETKIAGSVSEITRQLHRYAQLESVKAIILLSRRSNVPHEINGKPIRIITLWSQNI